MQVHADKQRYNKHTYIVHTIWQNKHNNNLINSTAYVCVRALIQYWVLEFITVTQSDKVTSDLLLFVKLWPLYYLPFFSFSSVSRLISYWWQKCLESDCTIRCSPIDSIMLIIYTVEAPTPSISTFDWWTTNSGYTLGRCFALQWLQVTCYFRFPCT